MKRIVSLTIATLFCVGVLVLLGCSDEPEIVESPPIEGMQEELVVEEEVAVPEIEAEEPTFEFSDTGDDWADGQIAKLVTLLNENDKEVFHIDTGGDWEHLIARTTVSFYDRASGHESQIFVSTYSTKEIAAQDFAGMLDRMKSGTPIIHEYDVGENFSFVQVTHPADNYSPDTYRIVVQDSNIWIDLSMPSKASLESVKSTLEMMGYKF